MNAMNKTGAARISNPLLAGLIYSLFWLGTTTIVISLILTFTDFKEGSLSVYIYLIHALSVAVGGFVAGKRAGTRGWYYGGIMGLIYAILIILVGFLGFDAAVNNKHTVILLVLAFLAGAVGGIFGVNARK